MSGVNKIHVASTTGLSLNDRFTAIATHSGALPRRRTRSRSRSRSMNRDHAPGNRYASVANRRLLQQLARKHKVQTALKLKRRSMRTFGVGGVPMKRGSIKALRVGVNGRPIRTNSLTKVATMRADHIINGNRRPLRRANSVSRVANRLGNHRPVVGGAAERVAKRRMELFLGRATRASVGGPGRRGRSRSRSRAHDPDVQIVHPRSSSRGRSLSRGPSTNRGQIGNLRRGRSRSRSRVNIAGARANSAIKARLGVRPGGRAGVRPGSTNGERRRGRSASVGRRGVAQGRVQKNRVPNTNNGNAQIAGGAGNRLGRARSRSAIRNATTRSRSRSRKGSVGRQQQQQKTQQQRSGGGMNRGGRSRSGARSQQRNIRVGTAQRNGKTNGTNGQQQQRRGRSRSRGVRNGRGRNIGNNTKQVSVNKDELDKELDQYMQTTKTENDMDFLLRN